MNNPSQDKPYEDALNEITERRVDRGLFARCFAEAMGDENRTKALYIRARADEIRLELKEKAEQASRLAKAKEEFLSSLTFASFASECVPLSSYSSVEKERMFEAWKLRKVRSAPESFGLSQTVTRGSPKKAQRQKSPGRTKPTAQRLLGE